MIPIHYYHKTNLCFTIFSLIVLVTFLSSGNGADCQLSGNSRRQQPNRNRNQEKQLILKDAFYEDNSFVVRIRTTYNHTSSITCNAILMEEQLVLSDVTCIKYHGMANIDAKFVHVIAGEAFNETEYEVEQIYINKADPRDPGTELALLKLAKPIRADTQCRQLIRPEKNHAIESDTAVRVIGYTNWFELKENRTKVVRRQPGSKYLCTVPSDLNETPGSLLLKGAPLLHMVDCKQYQLVGILTKLETIADSASSPKKHQDCYVMVSTQMKWYEQVKSLTSLAAKNDGASTQPSVVVVTVDN